MAVAVFIVFLIVGLCTQTAATFDVVTVETLDPPDGIQLHSSPIELAAVVIGQRGPLPNVRAMVTILSLTTGEVEELGGTTNDDGVVKALFPAQSGDYSWYVVARIEGYPAIVSRPRSFSTRMALIVDCAHPCSSGYPISLPGGYLDLQVIVTDMNGNPVESANVTFYVNSAQIYSKLTNPRGIATLLGGSIPPGKYVWFATASKDGEIGASRLSTFVVE